MDILTWGKTRSIINSEDKTIIVNNDNGNDNGNGNGNDNGNGNNEVNQNINDGYIELEYDYNYLDINVNNGTEIIQPFPGTMTTGSWMFIAGAIDNTTYTSQVYLSGSVSTFVSGSKSAGSSNFNNAIAAGSNGGTNATGVWSTSWSFAAVKRVAPTVVTYSPSAANANWYAPAGPDSSVTYTGTAGTGGIQATHSSAPTAGARMYYVHATADSEL
jgi:hypothetical protein